MSFHYSAFGLLISSFLPLTGLREADGKPDIVIEAGSVGSPSDEYSRPCAFVAVKPGCAIQELPGHGHILVTADKIVVEAFPEADEDLLRLFLLRNSIGLLMQLRGCLVFRGAAVEIGGKGVIIAAPACLGSSTLAMALVKRGAKLVSDELCVVAINLEGKPELLPYHPGISLWRDMAEAFNILPDNAKPVRKGLERYLIPLPDSFVLNPVLLSFFFSLREPDLEKPLLNPIRGVRKMQKLLNNTCNLLLSESLQLRQRNFGITTVFLSNCTMWEVTRPMKGNSKNSLPEMIESLLSGVDMQTLWRQ